jgi:hypothetical protein
MAKPIGSEFDDPWQVTSYEFTMVRNGQWPIGLKEATGNAFTPDMLEVLDN